MKRIVQCTVFAVLIVHSVYACDMCGGTSGNQYIGLLPAFNRNFIGVQYLTGKQSGTYPTGLFDKTEEHTTDYYNTVQLWGKHRIGQKYMIFAFVPYQTNIRVKDGIRSSYSGLGDMTIVLNRTFLNRNGGSLKHTIFGGVGVKLPTGNATKNSERSLPGVNPGTGTWDFSANANYTARYKNGGVNVAISGVLSTVASDKYKVGNRLNTAITGFYSTELGRFVLSPQLGCRYEYATQDFYNYQHSWINDYSGGQVLYGTAGLQVVIKNIGMRLTYMIPMLQQFNGNQVSAIFKANIGLFTTF